MANLFNLFQKQKTAFMPLYNKMSVDMKAGTMLTPMGNKFTKATARNYKSGAFVFNLFETENGTIYLEDINIQWAEKFTVFLMKNNYCKNSISNTLARLKAVLRRLYNKGISKFNGHGIRTGNEQITTVYNTIDEIILFLNLDLTDNPGMDRVRDVYVLQCFIGLRFSDLYTVLKSPEKYLREVGNGKFIEIKTAKTGEIVVIPLAKIVKDLLVKCNNNFNNMFTGSYYNLTIKMVAKRAGITNPVVFTRTEGGERTDTVYKKYELMSSHTARRTFATNAFLAGIPTKNIMLITGHKTTTSFDKYIRCTNMEAALQISTHSFFNLELPITSQLSSEIPENKLIE